MAPSFSHALAELQFVCSQCTTPSSIGCPSLWASVAWGPLFLHILGHSRWCLAICCPAWSPLSVGATAHMVEGLEKAAHNLWSMWVIVFWHLKNSWQKEKCWVKYTNPLLPSSSFDLYEKSDELHSSLCFPFISWHPSSLVPLPTVAGHLKVIFHRHAMDVQSLRDSLLTQWVLSEIENKFWPLLLQVEMFHKQLLFL